MRCKYKFLLILFVTVVIISESTSSLCGDRKAGFQNPADGICGNIDIRTNVSRFRSLENCTVIEGFLHISLIDHIDQSEPVDYGQWSFPLLREITDHLMLYRVFGLKSLRKLFPNLAIIRGRELFNNYALVAYEMRDLEELGLVNLRRISRGGVRLTKNKKLCYIETVDWTRLGVDPVAQNFKDNKEESQCANYCAEDCPMTKIGSVTEKRCWTSQHCQKNLNCKCNVNQSCTDDGTSCCHEYCLGGCNGTSASDCLSCKGVIYQNKCHPQCPPHTYMYFERRCLTDKECLSLKEKRELQDRNPKILRGEKGESSMCVFTCPENYTVQQKGDLKDSECIKCQGFCPKVCNGTDVNSIEDAQKLRHCSKINGPLVIQLMGGSNVAQEMEKNLGNIKEVTGYIQIRRSYALLTLYFFKSLEIIGGIPLAPPQGYSLSVQDNGNLQELFPEEQMKKMKILNGKVSFHNNRKLCLYKIYNFVNYLNLTEQPTEQDISKATNGDLKPCMEHRLNLSVTFIYHNSVILQWEKSTGDPRQLLTYIVNHKEIKDKNVDIDVYQGRDACSNNAWISTEQHPIESEDKLQSGAIFNLKAFTTYAVYVQPYTLSTATHSTMTNVVIFTTDPYYPTEPTDLEVTSEDPHELHVKWNPPKQPNGIITHYKVLYEKQELNSKSFEKRNYCIDPIVKQVKKTKLKVEEEEKKQNVTANCCACPKTKEEMEAEARKQEIEVYFENYMHSHVYCKRYDILPEDVMNNIRDSHFNLPKLSRMPEMYRLTEGLEGILWQGKNVSIGNKDEDVIVPYETNDVPKDNETNPEDLYDLKNSTKTVQEVVVFDTEVTLPNLEHFQEYSIEVQACQETNTEEKIETKLCSNRAITLGRTKDDWEMDRINLTTVEVDISSNKTGNVFIKWESPPNPNGLIIKYNIFYKKANQENLVAQQICVNMQQFKKHSGYKLTGLEPGNWTFQINAVSLAGNSSITAEKFFIVPPPPDSGDSSKIFIPIVVIAILVLIVIVVVIVWVVAKHKFHNDDMTVISPNINYVPSEQMYIMDGWEVDRDKIKLIKELGQGSFGMVYEGVAKGIGEDPEEELRVAVKTVNDRASFNDRREFLKEATTMKAFDCYHVVKLLGVVSTGQPALVIMELMALGDLKNYLREHRPDEHERPGVSPPKLLDILQMAGEIADGMAYLADKKFVHRDLAARNCMVAEDRIVKIGDFGMTRDIYETDYYRKGGKGMLPVRWMAPESLKDGVFTSMSDVWSYGVVMWEMVTLAAQPYQGLSNEEVVKYISEGSTMDMPDKCPQEMAHLMQQCWAKKPKNRPTFKEIIEYLLPHLSKHFENVSYFFNDGGGPTDGGGGVGTLGQPDDGSDDASSINSLSCEGAAAPALSHRGQGSGDFQFQGSPHGGGGSASLFDDGMDPEEYTDEDGESTRYFPQIGDMNIDDNFHDSDRFDSPSDCGVDDSSQPFMSEDFQAAVPYVATRQPSLLSHEPNGADTGLRNSGLIELQPLINKDRGLNTLSPTLDSVQLQSPFSSEYIGYQPPTLTNGPKSLGGPQSLQQNNPFNHGVTDHSGLPSDNTDSVSSPSWTFSRPQTANPLPSATGTRPTLRLPTLNQPPSGGFRRMPLFNFGDKNKDNNSSKNSQTSSSDHQHPPPPQPPTLVNMEGHTPSEETSPALLAQHYSPPPSAIASSSDGSKESTKSSGSHSLMNGLTNGHIPLSSVRHRTAPC